MIRTAVAIALVALAASFGCAYGAPAKSPTTISRPPVTTKYPNNPSPAKWLWETMDTWEKLPGFEYFNDMDCSAQAGIAVTSQGRILSSPDGGTHWQLARTGLPGSEDDDHPEFNCCLASGETLLAGGYRRIVMSRDGGARWLMADVPDLPREHYSNRDWTVWAISADPDDPNYMMALADMKRVRERRQVGTETRMVDEQPREVPIFREVTVRPDVTIVLRSTDGGRHWTPELMPGGLDMGRGRGLHYERRGTTIAIGHDTDRSRFYSERTHDPLHDVWMSADDGATWTPAPGPREFRSQWGSSYHVWFEVAHGMRWTACTTAGKPLWRSLDGSEWRQIEYPGRFAASLALISRKIGVFVGLEEIYHTLNADAASPRWVRDNQPEDSDMGRVVATPEARYPFVAAGEIGRQLAVFGAVPPANSQIRPRTMRLNPAR